MKTVFVAYLCLHLSACIGILEGSQSNAGGEILGALSCGEVSLLDPGPAPMKRLSRREYSNSIRTILGVDASDWAQAIPDDSVHHGFDNQTGGQSLSRLDVRGYLKVAESVASAFVGDTALLQANTACGTSVDDACLESTIDSLGKRFYRRPLSDSEREALKALADSSTEGGFAKIGLVVEGLMQSPKFVFRPEVAEGEVVDYWRKLDGYETATRLAYALQGTAPSAELLSAAEQGQLDTDEGIAKAAEDLLAEQENLHGIRAFYTQWFGVRGIQIEDFNAGDYGDLPPLQAAMDAEATQLIEDALLSESGDINELYTANYGYLNNELASHYGFAGPESDELQRVDLADDAGRRGLLAKAGILALNNNADGEPSALHRGLYLRSQVLCDPLPAPPEDIPVLEIEEGERELDAFARHTKDPACASCHEKLEPIGWGLDQYDGLGAERSEVEIGGNMQPVRTEGTLEGVDSPGFSGAVELGAKIAESGMGSSCAVQKLFQWSYGRSVSGKSMDDCLMDSFEKDLVDANYNLRQLIIKMVQSEAFRYRRMQEQE